MTILFPLWALLAGFVGVIAPDRLSDWRAAVMPLLGVVMFGMGATLRPADFLAIARRPALVGLGLCLQFGLMPLIGWALARVLSLPPELLVGMVLVGAAPGGTASNVICYLARGDVALSISLTAASTLLAVVLTPWLTWIYAGAWVTVPVLEMLRSIALVVLLPVIAGVAVNRFAGRWLVRVQSWMPRVSVLAILVIIAIVVALNAERLATVGLGLVVAVMLHNGLGLTLGYWGARAFGQDPVRARTLAIEVGMQNSGLAVALALKSFPVAAALPLGMAQPVLGHAGGLVVTAGGVSGGDTAPPDGIGGIPAGHHDGSPARQQSRSGSALGYHRRYPNTITLERPWNFSRYATFHHFDRWPAAGVASGCR